VTGYGLQHWDLIPYLSLLHRVQTDSGAHPASYPVGTGIKWLWVEPDNSPPSLDKVKNGLIKYRDNFTCYNNKYT
jgi:hypothetical protein